MEPAQGPSAVPLAPEPPKLDTALLWCRRDLRVTDNPALHAALQLAKNVIPVYVWAPEEEGQFQPGRCSRWWLHQSLGGFEADLQALGSGLVYRRGKESRTTLLELVKETGAKAVVFNHLYDPISLVRDNEVKAAMQEIQVHCQSFNGDMLYEPWEVLSESGQPFTCFQDFWDRVSSMEYPPRELLRVPDRMPPIPEGIEPGGREDLELMTKEEEDSNEQLYHSWLPGGKGAFMALEKFVQERLSTFSNDRAKTDRSSTSRLSPHIHFGEVSVRFIYYVVKQRELQKASHGGSCAEFLRQVAFREYSRYLSFHFPFTHERSLLEHLRAAPWKFDHRHFKAWRQGNTGYPMVDASMRQLWSTGWLHNRSRVICASFLVKNLLLPWQWGLKHYWDCLLDADLECDALGWQYCSGCLADAHPFDYMLNHIVEAKGYDPDGNYVRRWLPALARLPLKWIHKPWEAPEQVLADAGVEMGVTYPYPVVSLAESEAHLKSAAKVIQETLASSNPATQIPYRPASLPSQGQHPSSAPQTSPYGSSQPFQMPDAAKGPHPGSLEHAVTGGRAGNEAGKIRHEDEEVVSNMPGTAAPTGNSANNDQPVVSPSNQVEHGTAAAARDAAQEGAAIVAGSEDEEAVVPSMSQKADAPEVSADPSSPAAGMPAKDATERQQSAPGPCDELASPPRKRRHV